jgi:hypothetical protein
MWDWLHTHHDELQALSPIATIVASLVAVSVTGVFAHLQFRVARGQRDIAHEKLKFDAFDRQYERRAAIYQETRTFLREVFVGNISDEKIMSYGLRALDAKFLFYDDPVLHKYLAEVRTRVSMWHDAKTSAKTAQSDDERNAFEGIAIEQLNWIRQQGDDTAGFDVRFLPFLVYSMASKSPPR